MNVPFWDSLLSTAIYVLREGTLYSKRLYNRWFSLTTIWSDTDTKLQQQRGHFSDSANSGMLETCLVNLILRASKSRSLIWLLFRNLTKMHPKMRVWKMIFPFKEVIFRSHVSFLGSRSTQLLHLRRIVKCSKQIWFKCTKSRTQWHHNMFVLCPLYLSMPYTLRSWHQFWIFLTSPEINKGSFSYHQNWRSLLSQNTSPGSNVVVSSLLAAVLVVAAPRWYPHVFGSPNGHLWVILQNPWDRFGTTACHHTAHLEIFDKGSRIQTT